MRSFFAIIFAASWASSLFGFFRRLGPLGLFLLGIGDSSFLFIPFGNDLLLIALVSSGSSGNWRWVLYVIMAALGSVVGVFLVDLIMRKVGEEGLEQFVKPDTIKRLKSKLEDRAGWAVFIDTLLPPPFPFTAVVMTAAALQAPRRAILLAAFLGRTVRFTAEALLALYFGRKLIEYLNSDLVEYVVYGFVAIALVGSILSIRKWVRARRSWSSSAHATAEANR